MSMNDWLAQLKEGDEVIAVNGNGNRHVTKVLRLTPKMFAVESAPSRLFRRSDGREHGGGTWTSWLVVEARPEAVAAVREERRFTFLRRQLADVRWSTLPLSVLEQVNAVLESHSNAEKEG